ncbi:hypothetical protein Mgra_00004758 [Meloidogyne graminicola]|uniref:Uncharacterized protein n=1 Tax=Meloidogyne graminicola TaxID=189291 RepID=A0A8S9ZQF6_9BILA|nr:hypothetical protein Mgra_00004758 [Meloidogyne graminicola]
MIPFIIMTIIGIKMVKYINHHAFPNSQLKNYIKQLNKNLIILVNFISTIILIIYVNINPNTFYLQYICFIFFTFNTCI